MRSTGLLVLALLLAHLAKSQGLDIPKIKAELEKSNEPVAYVKNTLHKKYKIDTIAVYKLEHFLSLADSLAYHGKLKKVYGPFPNENYLVQILGKAPNLFYRASQIFIDTAVFKKKVADSLGTLIIKKIKSGASNFESMSRVYSMDGTSIVKGDMGWSARGSVIPPLEKAILSHKKGDIFKVWTKFGLHIIQVTEAPKQDTGFALLMRVFL